MHVSSYRENENGNEKLGINSVLCLDIYVSIRSLSSLLFSHLTSSAISLSSSSSYLDFWILELHDFIYLHAVDEVWQQQRSDSKEGSSQRTRWCRSDQGLVARNRSSLRFQIQPWIGCRKIRSWLAGVVVIYRPGHGLAGNK